MPYIRYAALALRVGATIDEELSILPVIIFYFTIIFQSIKLKIANKNVKNSLIIFKNSIIIMLKPINTPNMELNIIKTGQ